MLYFDNAATGGRKPETVTAAVLSATRICANPGRSSHKLSLACAEGVQAARKLLTDFFDGYSYENVIFTKNCTEALNIALFGLFEKGDHIVTTWMEHISVLRPLERLKERGVITYDVCPLEEGTVTPAALKTLLKPNTKAVIVTTASNVTGAAPDLKAIRAALPNEVLLLCDGAQGGGHLPLKMQETGIDVLCLAGHQGLLGIHGSGALLFSDRAAPRPLLYGGTGSESYSLAMPDFYPDALEAGTLSYPAVRSLFEGLNHLTVHGKEISSKMTRYTAMLLRGLKRLPAYRAYSEPNPCGIVALSHAEHQSEYLATLLSQKYDIATRGGLHCAPLMHQALGTLDGGLLRISFGYDTTERELDALLSALTELSSL